MEIDKLRTYFLEFIFMIVSISFTFFISVSHYVILFFLILFWFVVTFFLSKKKSDSIYQEKVFLLVILLSVIYLISMIGTGVFFGFSKGGSSILQVILPGILSFYFLERIRSLFLEQHGKMHFLYSFIGVFFFYLCLFQCTLTSPYVFSIFACSLLGQFLTTRYGFLSGFLFPIALFLTFQIPIQSKMPELIRMVISLFYPYLIYFTVEASYAKDNGIASYHERKRNAYKTGVLVLISILLVGLITGKFRYGLLVVGSESMSGSINKGDVVLFEKYKDQNLKKNDIIIYEDNGIMIIHRIVNIQKVNGVIQYDTKGDNNPSLDDVVVVKSKIKGKVHFHIPYIGRPTLWFHKEIKNRY